MGKTLKKAKVFIGISTERLKKGDKMLNTTFACMDRNFCEIISYRDNYKVYEVEVDVDDDNEEKNIIDNK